MPIFQRQRVRKRSTCPLLSPAAAPSAGNGVKPLLDCCLVNFDQSALPNRFCNPRNTNTEKAEAFSPELQAALELLLKERVRKYNQRIESIAQEN
jgi:hypothetical protein